MTITQKNFAACNKHFNNRLACLSREVLALPYLKPVLSTLALLGIYLVEPFYACTIMKDTTHSELMVFYTELHRSMGIVRMEEEEDYISCSKPHLRGVSEKLFVGVKKFYGVEVVDSVVEVASEYQKEVISLTNIIIPKLQTVLVCQRRDYGIDVEKFPTEFPVEQQAANVDDTPVNNLAMERQCGKVDYRLQKISSLQAVSRSIILQRAGELRAGTVTSFRGFKEAAKAKQELDLKWSEKTKENFKKGADEKQQLAQKVERKRLDMMEELKKYGGPFTDAQEVEQYLSHEVDIKKMKKRMKLELQFTRESSTLLPKVDPLFKIQVTLPTGKRRDKTPEEFGAALMSLLGKKENRATLEYSQFQESLKRLVAN